MANNNNRLNRMDSLYVPGSPQYNNPSYQPPHQGFQQPYQLQGHQQNPYYNNNAYNSPPTPPRNAPATPPILTSSSTSKPTTSFAKQKKKLGWDVPTLYIPPPTSSQQSSSHSHHNPLHTSLHMPPPSAMSSNPSVNNPYLYPKHDAGFLFNQFNGIRDFTMGTAKTGLGIGEKCSFWLFNKFSSLSRQWFTHIFLTIVIIIYTVGGAAIFATVEGTNEDNVLIDIRNERYKLIRTLQQMAVSKPALTKLEEWEGEAALKLEEFEDFLIEAFKKETYVVANHGPKIWTFWNSMVYCSTIYTTIGYGHMAPTTVTGRALTIVYAIIGIPLFLIILTDFGKLFTRIIKYAWSFVRRVYYTGSCRKVRKEAHVDDITQFMYEVATFRRPSMFAAPNPEDLPKPDDQNTNTPTTPAPSNFEIDDEFNLPISLAIFILLLYIFLGSLIYLYWEEWDFFASFYFVFISMSTIGFGDFVPQNAVCMIVSIVYLVFGLALMSMCINVVQAKLSDTFKHASAKIGATFGVQVADEDGSITTVPPNVVEMPEVHKDHLGDRRGVEGGDASSR